MYKILTDNLEENVNEGVYFIRNKVNNLLKIGRSKNLKNRFLSIKSNFKFCGLKAELEIELFIECNFSIELEKLLHEEYNDFRESGEWFSIDNINTQQIMRVVKICENNLKEEKIKVLEKCNNEKIINIDSMQICEQKLDKYNIPKQYLIDKSFSYKLYLNLCNIAFWECNKDNQGVENIRYTLFNYKIRKMSKLFNISCNTIKYKISQIPFKIIENKNVYGYNRNNKNLIFESPKENYTTIELVKILQLINLDEMDIRFYILLNSMESKVICNITQEGILNYIGYNGKSNNNKNKLTNSIRKLEKLKLIKTKYIYEDGLKRLTYNII